MCILFCYFACTCLTTSILDSYYDFIRKWNKSKKKVHTHKIATNLSHFCVIKGQVGNFSFIFLLFCLFWFKNMLKDFYHRHHSYKLFVQFSFPFFVVQISFYVLIDLLVYNLILKIQTENSETQSSFLLLLCNKK
jgi:hypothetical protein